MYTRETEEKVTDYENQIDIDRIMIGHRRYSMRINNENNHAEITLRNEAGGELTINLDSLDRISFSRKKQRWFYAEKQVLKQIEDREGNLMGTPSWERDCEDKHRKKFTIKI